MREMIIQFKGDGWDDEAEAEWIEAEVVDALDNAGVDYLDVAVR